VAVTAGLGGEALLVSSKNDFFDKQDEKEAGCANQLGKWIINKRAEQNGKVGDRVGYQVDEPGSEKHTSAEGTTERESRSWRRPGPLSVGIKPANRPTARMAAKCTNL